MFDIPILLTMYNRPNITKLVLEELLQVKPKYLFLAADGPKRGVEEDIRKCTETREMIRNVFFDKVDWNCEVKLQYQLENLGGKWGGYTAVDWFFQNVDKGIILEDDDLADQSFFYFCKELLGRYEDSNDIGIISGDNFQFGKMKISDSYYFSKYIHGWGWATWKKVWNLLDIDMKDWPDERHMVINPSFIDDTRENSFWRNTLDRMYAGATDAWDYQFSYYLWKNNKLNIIPSINLVTNIGSEDSTHEMKNSPLVNVKRNKMLFPLKHPIEIKRNIQADINSLGYYL
jgi:hypothetical protein